MAVDYNSELIDRLYTEQNSRKATLIADEMAEINDPIFIYPIVSAYKRFKNSNHSHYFITDLTNFTDVSAYEAMKPLIPSFDASDVSLSISFLEERKYNDPAGIKNIQTIFESKVLGNEEVSEYELEEYLSFLETIGILEKYERRLDALFKNPAFAGSARQTALRFLFRLNKPKRAREIIDEFGAIRAAKAELIVTKEVIRDDSSELSELKEYIATHGTSAAKELLEAAFKKKIQSDEAKEVATSRKYSNARILSEISAARLKIDTLSQVDSRLRRSFLRPYEKLYQQFESATDRKQLISNLIDLRGALQSIDPSVSDHGLSIEDAKTVIAGISNFSGTINNLHLTLHARGLVVDHDFLACDL